jgi:lysozyme
MKFSEKGQNKLKELEGFLSVPVRDAAGHLTVGYGHKVVGREVFSFLREPDAHRLMMKDVAPIEGLLTNTLKTRLSQNQFDALVIFIYNIGTSAFLNSGVFRALQRGEFLASTVPWAKWVNISKFETDPKTGEKIKKLIPLKGLQNRRAKEIQLFNA